ncbi:ABC transporter ATP-binding protein [Caldicellulosiruptor acetigenus]|uniref:ABC transporter ATP-binding protein n=1 Tax=Caldicellulosiruptor acetigenus TaxID=301953 RepID=UPI001E45801F|nr:ABC transporter ATP-binding protein [Caldicellulosiruptor acetigenus]
MKTENLTKEYSSKNGCFNINLEIEKPMVFGLLGPNGAGKSTLVKTLVGLLRPTRGKAFLLGKPFDDIVIKSKIGYLPENFKYPDWMTAYEVMEFHCQLLKMKNYKNEIYSLLEKVGIIEHKDKKIRLFSKGMQQRLGLAVSMLNRPEIIFLDEPTSALDPIGRIDVRNIIIELKNQGTTVFLNSHLLSEVEKVCDKVAIINNGYIVAMGTIDELTRKALKVTFVLDKVDSKLFEIISLKNINILNHSQTTLELELSSHEDVPILVEEFVRSGYKIYEVKKSQELENVFLQVIGEGYFDVGNNKILF